MNTLIRTYDPKTKRDLLGRQETVPRASTHGIMPARVALMAIRANAREINRKQNWVRWSVNETSITSTWNPATLYPVLFDTEHFGTEDLKGSKVHCNPTVSWRYTCGRTGKHQMLGNITMLISYPAIPATMIQRVFLWMRVKSYKDNTLTLYQLSQNIASVGVAGGIPVAHYLRGWSLPIATEVHIYAGDQVEFFWQFQGAGAISFIDEYEGHISIERVGEQYIDGDCCNA